MGLDMYLQGRKFLFTSWKQPELNQMEDGFRVSNKTLELGYWRKHPNLHGYIVGTFADGIDECQDIPLEEADLEKIIKSVRSKCLPHTEGFFFGESDGSEDEETIHILTQAISWLKAETKDEARSVVYRASW